MTVSARQARVGEKSLPSKNSKIRVESASGSCNVCTEDSKLYAKMRHCMEVAADFFSQQHIYLHSKSHISLLLHRHISMHIPSSSSRRFLTN